MHRIACKSIDCKQNCFPIKFNNRNLIDTQVEVSDTLDSLDICNFERTIVWS